MSQGSQGSQERSIDRWLYGGAAALAVAAGLFALAGGLSGPDGEEDTGLDAPAQPAAPRAPVAPGAVRFGDAGPELSARVGPDFVPDLPEVPDLEREPPPPRAAPADPRMEQLGSEMRILSRARELLAEHPAEALGILETHRRRYPEGVLCEEREAFVIETLVALEHVDEAERRYYDFLSDFPDSDFRERLRETMLRAPAARGPDEP